MQTAPIPSNEINRLKNLYSYQILDTNNEILYNDLVELAAQICDCPSALISFVDEDRQWFKATLNVGIAQLPRDTSFCGHAIIEDEIFEITDAKNDNRFYDNPNVTGPLQIGFYAGMPIKSSKGYNLGTVCVIDNKPKKLTEKQKNGLQKIAIQISTLLELRINNKLLKQELGVEKAETERKIEKSVIALKEMEQDVLKTVLRENVNQILAATNLFLGTAKKSTTNNKELIDISMSNISNAMAEVKKIYTQH
jgi:GAF domain-containing protein